MNSNARRCERLRTILALLPGLLIMADAARPTAVRASNQHEWLGKRVITKSGTVLRIAASPIDEHESAARKDARTYRVKQMNDPWIWKDYDKAIADYDTAIRIDPTQWLSRNVRGLGNLKARWTKPSTTLMKPTGSMPNRPRPTTAAMIARENEERVGILGKPPVVPVIPSAAVD